MGLNEIAFPKVINTGSSSAIDKLFIPALHRACQYNVAVAYFTSGWIADAAPGLANFVANGGRLQWIISPDLKPEDLEAINLASSDEECDRIICESTESLLSKMKYEPREILRWMISDGVLDIRFAVPRPGHGGIFHAKIGFFRDSEGNTVSFSGSYNQTAGANRNWERIEIFQAREEPDRANMIVDDWDKLWNNLDDYCQVFKASEVTITKIRNSISSSRPYKISFATKSPKPLVKLRAYQERAIDEWFANKGRGIFLMATGSGKTITALSLLSRFHEKTRAKSAKLIVVIALPYRHLLDQWANEAELFGFSMIRCYESKATWLPKAQAALADLRIGVKDIAVLATTYTTLCLEDFQKICEIEDIPFLFIGDEIHNAAEGNRNLMLPSRAQFRLGLTATPERSSEPGVATQNLEAYFGRILIEFDIQEAITNGYLTPYDYHPIPCRMSPEEFDEYVNLTQKIGTLIAASRDGEDDALKTLLMRRARLVGDMSSKYEMLDELMKTGSKTSKSIIYCSDYSSEDKKPIEKCVAIANGAGYFTQKFTYIESVAERAQIIRQLTEGTINAVAAVRCLDEGVDIPSVDTAYILASSTSFRQFVQRRGRVLRLAPNKSKAIIYDFIAYPPDGSCYTEPEIKAIHSLSSRELERAKEFSRISLNAYSCLKIVSELEELEKIK